MDWQKLALAGTLAHDAAGQWQHRYALWSVARQNGKSRTLEALLCWWLTEHAAAAGPQVVTLTAHQLRLTGKIFERIQAVLEGLDVLAPRGPAGRKLRGRSAGKN